MTKEELIKRMYERAPNKKKLDAVDYLKKTIILFFKRNCAFMLNAPKSLIDHYTSQIHSKIEYLKTYLDVKVEFDDELDYRYLSGISSGAAKHDRIMQFGFNDGPEAIVRPYSRDFELRSTFDTFVGLKFRLYVDGENPPGSVEFGVEMAMFEFFDRMISRAYETYEFSEEDLQKEFNDVLSGEVRIWGM